VEAEEASDDGVVMGMVEDDSDEPEGNKADMVGSKGFKPTEEEADSLGAVASGAVMPLASVADPVIWCRCTPVAPG